MIMYDNDMIMICQTLGVTDSQCCSTGV